MIPRRTKFVKLTSSFWKWGIPKSWVSILKLTHDWMIWGYHRLPTFLRKPPCSPKKEDLQGYCVPLRQFLGFHVCIQENTWNKSIQKHEQTVSQYVAHEWSTSLLNACPYHTLLTIWPTFYLQSFHHRYPKIWWDLRCWASPCSKGCPNVTFLNRLKYVLTYYYNS
jgi:hypothetical protein